MPNHQNNFSTNLTSNTLAGATTTPINSIPTVDAPYYIALDADNDNSHYEVVHVTSDTATNINHAATAYAHTTAEAVRMIIPATEMDALSNGWMPIPGTLAYSSADDPTYVITTTVDMTTFIPVGSRIKMTNDGSVKYFIVTAIAAGTITLYGGTDYDVANSAITLPYYSLMKAPVGFPLSPAKWRVTTADTSDRYQTTPTQNTWYNLNSTAITIPIGVWNVTYYVLLQQGTAAKNIFVTLSTGNNTESDSTVTSGMTVQANNERNLVVRKTILTAAAKTAYYLNTRSTSASSGTIQNLNSETNLLIEAVCAYL